MKRNIFLDFSEITLKYWVNSMQIIEQIYIKIAEWSNENNKIQATESKDYDFFF